METGTSPMEPGRRSPVLLIYESRSAQLVQLRRNSTSNGPSGIYR